MKTSFLIVIFLFIGLSSFSTTITSKYCGKWTDPSTWDLNRAPGNSDTIIVDSFVSFDTDFTSVYPGLLKVTECGTLCGSYSYTGHFWLDGVVYLNQLTASYGSSYSHKDLNIQQYVHVINQGTSYYSTGGLCVGCTSQCINCSTSKVSGVGCNAQNVVGLSSEHQVEIVYSPQDKTVSFTGGKNALRAYISTVHGLAFGEYRVDGDLKIDAGEWPAGVYVITLVRGEIKRGAKLVIY